MHIDIRGSNMEVSGAIDSYIRKKCEAFQKLLTNVSGSRLYIEVEKTTDHHRHGDVFRAEFNLELSGDQLRAEAVSQDVYAATDEVKDDLLEKIKSRKDKRLTLFKRGHQKIKDFIRGFSS